MAYDLLNALTNEQLKTDPPKFNIGDTVRVHNKIKEGARERIQLFEGTVIAKRGGGINETFTVRRVSYGVGTEKTFLDDGILVGNKVTKSVLTPLDAFSGWHTIEEKYPNQPKELMDKAYGIALQEMLDKTKKRIDQLKNPSR